jgi:hypothetical protein
MVHTTGWLKGLQVTADGTGIVSHVGLILVRALADNTGLTCGLSAALASRRLLVHDRGRVLADLACAIADGGEVIRGWEPGKSRGLRPVLREPGAEMPRATHQQRNKQVAGVCDTVYGSDDHRL